MNPKIQILCSLRLAPVQCHAVGHPVTTGFKNIDFALSPGLMEPKNAQKYYSEKLVLLPNTGICYEEPRIDQVVLPKQIKNFQKISFLNLQSLYKLLPQDDHIYVDIAKKFNNCQFWFLEKEDKNITNIFKKRLSNSFKEENLSFNKFFIFFPKLTRDEFVGLIKQADIILDSINWSGHNTSHEAFNLNKPIVTLPSSLMRGRHTYCFQKILETNDTIASSKIEYVKIAVKLASDINFRNSIINKIKKNKHRLFNDEKPIRFLEVFFKKIMKK